jgi:hypothetical protein
VETTIEPLPCLVDDFNQQIALRRNLILKFAQLEQTLYVYFTRYNVDSVKYVFVDGGGGFGIVREGVPLTSQPFYLLFNAIFNMLLPNALCDELNKNDNFVITLQSESEEASHVLLTLSAFFSLHCFAFHSLYVFLSSI